MTAEEIVELFSKHPFQEAKEAIRDECEREGIELDGNETVFDMEAKLLGVYEKSNNGYANASQDAYASDEPVPAGDVQPQDDGDKREPRKRKCKIQRYEPSDDLEKMERELEEYARDMRRMDSEKRNAQEEYEELERRICEEKRKRVASSTANPMDDNDVLDEVAKRMKCLGKAFLVGPAGTGKSTLAIMACARLFGIRSMGEVLKSGKFAQISFSPDTLSCDMIGFTDIHGKYHETDVVRVFRDGGVILFDEMDNADASILVKLNTMVANGILPTPNGIVEKHPDTYFVGTANTWLKGGDSMYVGRARLDAATIDRWAMSKIEVQYSSSVENAILKAAGIGKAADQIRAACATIRKIISDSSMKMVCSTRFIEDAAKLAKAGYTHEQILSIYLLGADAAYKKRISGELAKMRRGRS